MSLEYTVDHAKGLVRTVATGQVSVRELLEGLASVIEDAPKPYRELWDGTELEDLGITPEDARLAIDTVVRDTRYAGARVALVAGKRDFLYGMSRLTEAVAALTRAPIGLRAFRELAEAEAWLLEPVDQPTRSPA